MFTLIANTYAIIVWPQQSTPYWNDPEAIWMFADGTASPSSPGLDDFTYVMSTEEVKVRTVETVRRLYIDRALDGFTPAASTVTVVPGGRLIVDSIAQFGADVDGGTLTVAGGVVEFAATDRGGTWSVRLDHDNTASINVPSGRMIVGSGSSNTQVLAQSRSQTQITVSGNGSLEMYNGATLNLFSGQSGVQLSGGGLLKYVGADARTEIIALANDGKLQAASPLEVPPFAAEASHNGVGWYYDGTDTYAFAFAGQPPSSTIVISSSCCVQDTHLRSGIGWQEFNYGNSPYLQVGHTPSNVYGFYEAVSLMRFDLTHLPPIEEVVSARVELYVPRNQVQLHPLMLHLHAVSPANAAWTEGASRAQPEPQAACWDALAQDSPWAGSAGLGTASVDFEVPALASHEADGLDGRWLEFDIPPSLVNQWLQQPDSNAGLLIRSDDNLKLAQHTHIVSSEHWSGKGPRLIIESSQTVERPFCSAENCGGNARHLLPPPGEKFEQWRQDTVRSNRYVIWAEDVIGLDKPQRIFPYLWDIFTRGDVMLNTIIPLRDMFVEIPAVIDDDDHERAFEMMTEFMPLMKIYDYAREQHWYNAGPAAEYVSLLDIARFFIAPADARYNGIFTNPYEDGRWRPSYSDEEIAAQIQNKINRIQNRFQLDPDSSAFSAISNAVNELLPVEYYHRTQIWHAYEDVAALIEQENDGREMLEALRRMFFHHRMFLLHQSLFSRPFYDVLMEHAPMVAYLEWLYDVRLSQYSPGRINPQIQDVESFYWKPNSEPHPPFVDAGRNREYWINPLHPLRMQGTVVAPFSTPQSQWSVSPSSAGLPDSVTILDISDPMTIMYFDPADPNIFTFRLTVTDHIGSEPFMSFDEVVIATHVPTCQDVIAAGLTHPMDVSGPVWGQPDCYVNIYDFAYFARSWLECSDPQNPRCQWPF